jgi:hypothetical protein
MVRWKMKSIITTVVQDLHLILFAACANCRVQVIHAAEANPAVSPPASS